MRKSMKAALAAAAAATMALGSALPAAANAQEINVDGCTVSFYNSKAADYASSYDPHEGCGLMRVRHLYVVQGGYGYWTSWSVGGRLHTATDYFSELSYSQHTITTSSGTHTYSLAGS